MSVNRRIAWLSPYGPQSDIGAYTRCLLPHFAEGEGGRFDCDLFVNPNGQTYDSPVPMMNIPASGAMGEILSRYDAAFFNVGNNVQNHDHIVSALRRTAGVAILHDFSSHHLFAHQCFSELRSPAAYARLLHDYHGTGGFNMALRSGIITRDATLYAPWDGENVADYPLTQPIAMLASAIVVHSRYMEQHVAKIFKGPILRLFLPRDQKLAPSAESVVRWRSDAAKRHSCLFSTFGHISRSKCLDTIILAISQSPELRARSRLIIAGKPDDKEYVREIEALIVKHGLTKQVALEYDVTNERLLAIKNETDVFLNLRYPNTEGASGSLIEMMNAGRPVICYRAGCYAEVPEDAAVLIQRADGVRAVSAAMERLMSSPEEQVKIGIAAGEHLQGQDSANYVRRLKTFVNDVQSDLRRRARLVVPARDGLPWKRSDVAAEDSEWFADLTRARRSLLILERDHFNCSPEIFLTWPMDDLTAFVGRVLLRTTAQPGLSALLADYAQRLGRWPFYRLISRMCVLQALCEQAEFTTADIENYAERIPEIAFWDIAARLQPDIFTRLLYLCVLGRGTSPGETDSWTRKIRQGMPASSLLQEFLGSTEYRQAFSDTVMFDLEEWAHHESILSISRGRNTGTQIAWPIQSSVNFNEDNSTTKALLGQFWHRHEKQGSWSNGRTGDLHFLLPDGAETSGATLTLHLRVAGTRVTGPRKVMALHDRAELASTTIRDDLPLSWTVPLPATIYSKDGVSLLLVVDQDFSPAATGQSQDRRSLGVMLIKGQIALGSVAPSASVERSSNE